MQERVQKFLSSSGVVSRRKAEDAITAGQVFINGRRARLGDKVNPETDKIKYYGKLILPQPEKIYLMLNKPKGVVVSKKDPRGRKTVFDLLPPELKTRVWNVGRLDFDTEGLLILTNDGELTQTLAHPKYEHEKEYEVITDLEPTEGQLEKLRGGVTIATGLTYPAKAKIRNEKIYLIIHEGKKRQIKRMFDAIGLAVTGLKRIRLGKLVLPENLPAGAFKKITKQEIISD